MCYKVRRNKNFTVHAAGPPQFPNIGGLFRFCLTCFSFGVTALVQQHTSVARPGLARLGFGSARPSLSWLFSARHDSAPLGSALTQAMIFPQKYAISRFQVMWSSAARKQPFRRSSQEKSCLDRIGSARPGLGPLCSARVRPASARTSPARLSSYVIIGYFRKVAGLGYS